MTMKRISLLLALGFGMYTGAYAQLSLIPGKIASNELSLAKKVIDKEMEKEKNAESAQAYFLFGQVYQLCLESPNPEFNTLVQGSDVERIYEAYLKTEQLDVKNKYTKKLPSLYTNLKMDCLNYAIGLYNDQNFPAAIKAFERVMEISSNPLYIQENGQVVDSAVMFNTAVAAYQAHNFEIAEKYYKKALEIWYREESVYEMLAHILKEQDKNDEAIVYMKDGAKKYPENNYLLVEMINYYLESENPLDAIPYLDEAIAMNPNTVAFIRSKGNILEKSGQTEEALELYRKVLEIDPNDFYSTYEIGVIELEKVNDYQAKVQDIADNREYNAAMKEVYKQYEQVLSHFEKASSIQPDDRNALITLRELYYKLRNVDEKYEKKYEEIKAKL